jgi:hypothetical protein
MPPGRDWTAEFRRPILPVVIDGGARDDDDSNDDDGDDDDDPDRDDRGGDDDVPPAAAVGLVEEYILVGEADDGTCGHNWRTWGNPDFRDDDDGVAEREYDERRRDDDVARRVTESPPPYVLDGYAREDLEGLSMMQFSRFDCKRRRESKTVSFRRIACGELGPRRGGGGQVDMKF